MKNKKGFTLIELLVVIAIIGLLATLSIVALNNARARARDARRVADVKQIQTALELYYNNYGEYPQYDIMATTTRYIGSGTTFFMNPVPTAPAPADSPCTINNSYDYSTTIDGGYILNYCLGMGTGGIDAGPATATQSTINSPT